eukprot:2367532-Alexandrium_andersonii.AAC.1
MSACSWLRCAALSRRRRSLTSPGRCRVSFADQAAGLQSGGSMELGTGQKSLRRSTHARKT